MSGLFALVGLGAVLFPLVIRLNNLAIRAAGWAWTLAGYAFLIFGGLNFFTHIGLIVNTTPSGG